MTPGSPQSAPSDQIAELTRRLKRLERRLDFVLTGFLFLVLLALTAPLIVFAFAPDTIRSIQIFQRPLFAPRSTPTTNPTSAAAQTPGAGSSTTKPANPKALSPLGPSDDNESSGPGGGDDETVHSPRNLTSKPRTAGKS
jgi:hypothetical protein